MAQLKVPFFKPAIGEQEIDEVLAALRSGWLTSGPLVRRFEKEFAEAVHASHAVAVNSCTAALHLALEALGLQPGQAVLVPTMTFAATAEVVRYLGAVPILVDCDPATLNMDLHDAERKLEQLRSSELPVAIPGDTKVVGIIPVHVGGMMMDVSAVRGFASRHNLWIVEDAAHAFPAAWRLDSLSAWETCGQNTSAVTCYSFYANKTITTGEGGMAVTSDAQLADRMRLMSLHGLSHDAWGRYSGGGSWDYRIVAPGFKYNLTDIAAAIGIHQLQRANSMRDDRETIAQKYLKAFGEMDELSLPILNGDRLHSWHLFPIRLNLSSLRITRDEFMVLLKEARVGCSVHWRPLHLHPYYQETFGWRVSDFPVSSTLWEELVSLPIFPGMSDEDLEFVVQAVKGICHRELRQESVFVR